MIRYAVRAVVWGLSRVARVPRDEAVTHRSLEHAHWDRSTRRWYTHADDAEGTAPRAA